MEHTEAKQFLKDERKKTDDSLVAERDKTNLSITKTKISKDEQADKIVENDRNLADQATTELRYKADIISNKKRIDSGLIANTEIKISSDQLSLERNRSDKAIELERSQVDIAIEKERELKIALVSQLLEQERKLTDKNLSAERTRTDAEVQRATGLLSEEISEHTKTKNSLTTRDEFLAIVSHDLRNPIGTASMCAEMLLENPAFQTLGTEARKSVELIKRNIDTSLRLIADLLDMERIEGGKLQLKIEKFNINHIIKEVVEIFAYTAHAKNITLHLTPLKISNEVFCDKDRIIQVLTNLIGNALKFTPRDGTIAIDIEVNKTELQVSVRDSGPGIPEEKKIKIFERYAQLGINNRDGLGLGLYISKMLVEAHHGRLWVHSKLGHGSTFCFSFPHSREV